MRNEQSRDRGRLKGYMWESVVLKLLAENGFDELQTVDGTRTRRLRAFFLEMRGRGSWHQIDCPCDYKHFIPFINPIRLLGEVKFHTQRVDKALIREFIGVLKDIHENYFVPDNFTARPTQRHTEIGVYFSANGYEPEAERLAFAHNIRTLSYENIEILQQLKEIIQEMERNFLSAARCISADNQGNFIEMFRAILAAIPDAIPDFIGRFAPSAGFEQLAEELQQSFLSIESSFVASSSGGALLHFIGLADFPNELFAGADNQLCRVYYEGTERSRRFYLEFSDDHQRRRFYFSPPTSLEQAVFFGPTAALNEKRQIFRSLHLARQINGIARNLTLILDNDWVEGLLRKV